MSYFYCANRHTPLLRCPESKYLRSRGSIFSSLESEHPNDPTPPSSCRVTPKALFPLVWGLNRKWKKLTHSPFVTVPLPGCDSILRFWKLLSMWSFFHYQKQEQVAWGEVWTVGWMVDQFHWSALKEVGVLCWHNDSLHCRDEAGFPSSQFLVASKFSRSAGRQIMVCHCTVTMFWFSRTPVTTCPLVEKKATAVLFLTLVCPLSAGSEISFEKYEMKDCCFIWKLTGRPRFPDSSRVSWIARFSTLKSVQLLLEPFYPCQDLISCQIVWLPTSWNIS